ncbi:GFA family protein [Bosea sp. (in: a-proteobacteria)]|uniref:GFA family protein n=1 Tax=Bosea sp. (in: a-proteobacteria) TaxID=1871050 RepID=UPI003F71648B
MSGAFIGGCACGAIRYEISAEPLAMTDCQCRHCQQRSGTGHGSYITFPSRQAVKLRGEARHWDIAADNGNVKTHGFCPNCGTPVHLTFSAAPDRFAIHAASLDDPGRYKPQAVVFTASGHAWDRIDPALPNFEGMPPSEDPA